jgi:hypothetical protein
MNALKSLQCTSHKLIITTAQGAQNFNSQKYQQPSEKTGN